MTPIDRALVALILTAALGCAHVQNYPAESVRLMGNRSNAGIKPD